MSVSHVAGSRIAQRDIATFRGQLSGDLLGPQDAAYGQARRVWNGMVDRYPALIARCLSTEDVIAAIRFGRDHELPIAVRGGGHNVAGLGTCDNGIVLDLSGMRSVELDASTARVGPGHSWGSFDAAASQAGMATTGGLVSTTGVAGFTLGGGLGWLMRRHGLACDNLLGATIVTADGALVAVDEKEEAELLWGLRGGGGNFGVVTSLTFAMHPVTTVVGGLTLFPADRAREVLSVYAELTASAPADLTTLAALTTAPPAPFVPEALQGRPAVAIAACHIGNPAAAERALAPIRALRPAADLIAAMPYVGLQSMLDAAAPAGQRHYWKSGYLRTLEPTIIDALVEQAERMPIPFGQIHLHQMGGAVAEIAPDATAFAHRDAEFTLNILGTWEGTEGDEAGVAWAREAFGAIEPWTDGVYVNFLGVEGEDRVRAAYGPATHARLAALKRRLDPDNVFHLNQNVRPAAGVDGP